MLSHLLTDRKSSLKSQGREINNDLVTPHRPVQTWNSRAVHNRASTPAPISETFGRSQETSTSSNIEQNCKTNGLENFRKNLVEKELLTFAGRFHQICCLDISYMVKTVSSYKFYFSKLTKSWKKGKAPPCLQLRSYPQDRDS